jgi:PAS domain S-box-containing protein
MHLNITERKEAEIASSRLAAIVESSNDAIIGKDLTGTITSWNKGAENIFGYSASEMVGTSILRLIPAERHGEEKEILLTLGRGEGIEHFETRRLTKDGRLIDVSVTASPIKNVDGEIVGAAKMARDITERKRAEQSLKQSEAWLDAIFDASRDGIVVEENDLVIYANKALANLYGYGSPEEMIGKHVSAFRAPDENQRLLDFARQRIAGEDAPTIYEFKGLKKDSSLFDAEVSVSSFQSDGKTFIVSTLRDVTKRKQAECDLRESDEKFQQLAASVTDVFYVTSLDLQQMHYVSPAYEKIWGRSTDSLYANPYEWGEAILPEERAKVISAFSRLAADKHSVSVEFRIARPDGTVRSILSRGFGVRDVAGKVIRITGIASDITDRKNLEAQLRQAQKMEAIGTLAGGIAHDFNNILAAIMGYSELAQRVISKDSRAQTHLQQVLIASTRARNLVTQILTFSRQEEPERKVLKLQPIIGETLKLLRASLPSTIEIRQSIDTTAPSVMGDATQLHQVTMNLCVNAGHAMKERGGVLGIRLACVDIDRDFASAHPELKKGPHVCLEVSDSGSGMDRATQERIFEPFFTTKAPGEGTGLGLAVVHGVIKNHEGAIVISSALGVGTTFGVYLPVFDGPPALILHESDSVPRGKGEHILFVDDEEMLVSLGKLVLEDLGYRVTSMVDSVEALAAFRSQPEHFDLVITDQTMPRLSGAELATALLEIRPALPIILVTGYSAGMTDEKARATGFRESLPKPCPIPALGEAIRRSLVQTKKE